MIFKSVINIFLTIFYFTDKQAFIENFCENIDKPELKCNGKCQLKKITEEERNKEDTPKFIFDVSQLEFVQEKLSSIVFLFNIKTNKGQFYYINNYTFTSQYSIYHPPKF